MFQVKTRKLIYSLLVKLSNFSDFVLNSLVSTSSLSLEEVELVFEVEGLSIFGGELLEIDRWAGSSLFSLLLQVGLDLLHKSSIVVSLSDFELLNALVEVVLSSDLMTQLKTDFVLRKLGVGFFRVIVLLLLSGDLVKDGLLSSALGIDLVLDALFAFAELVDDLDAILFVHHVFVVFVLVDDVYNYIPLMEGILLL